MTDFLPFDSAFGEDGQPFDAATLKLLVKGNLSHLESLPACSCAWRVMNGQRTTQSTTYDEDSILYRSPKTIQHGLSFLAIAQQQFTIRAKVSAGTATIRVTCSAQWRRVADPAGPNDLEEESAAGAITSTTGEDITLTIGALSRQCMTSHYGSPPPGEGPQVTYLTSFFNIQGTVNSGANTLTLIGVTRTEVP